MKTTIVSIANQFRKSVESLKALFAKQEPKKNPAIAPIAPEKIAVQIDSSAHISGIAEEFVNPYNWEHECYVQMDGDFERFIRKPNRINKKLSYRKKKSQAKNWDKWKRKGQN